MLNRIFGTHRVLNTHPPDQYAEVRLDLRPPSPRTRPPTPVATKAGTMPLHEGLRTDDREDLQDRRKPSIQLDKEPAIDIRQPNPTMNLTPQNDQLMSERRILCLKPTLRQPGDAAGRSELHQQVSRARLISVPMRIGFISRIAQSLLSHGRILMRGIPAPALYSRVQSTATFALEATSEFS